MPIEEALIKQTQPYMMIAKLKEILQQEIMKGCNPLIHQEPVSLESPYESFVNIRSLLSKDLNKTNCFIPGPKKNEWQRLMIWISSNQKFDWNKCELFLKQLQLVNHRIGFEIVGNEEMILFYLLCHIEDLPIVQGVFRGEFEYCELSREDLIWQSYSNNLYNIVFNDYYPIPPYSHLLTRYDELKISPYQTLMMHLSEIEAPSMGVFQVLFQPVSPLNNWHRNVETFLDFEYQIKLLSNMNVLQRYQHQIPSGDLRQMAFDVSYKAHNDKPFYSVALRIGIIGSGQKKELHLKKLSSTSGLFQHGGRPLKYITEQEYVSKLSSEQIEDMFLLGTTYRHGFLLNSQELCSLVHIPYIEPNTPRKFPVKMLVNFPVEPGILSEGTQVGFCPYAGTSIPVCIPDNIRGRHTHLIGRSGMGKTTLLEQMILDDAEKGHGVAILDPHGDLVEKLLNLFPEKLIHRTIYFNPGDPDWIPLWNPMELLPGQNISRVSDNLVGAIKNVVTGWGDRLEHLLRNAFYALLQMPNTSLLDVYNLLIKNSNEGKLLKKEILKIIDNVSAERFWKNDFERYKNEDLSPPKHKLSKLLISGSVSLMLSQPENAFNLRKIMDEGKILLVDLSAVGSEVREILGCFLLSLLHQTALGRSNVSVTDRKQFHVYCDEAHRFVTDAMEDLIAETRKFGVSLTLAHQYISQFSQRKTDAISNVGSTIIFNVDTKDAKYLMKDLRGKVKTEDIISLGVGEAIARIGIEVVRINTPTPLKIAEQTCREQIIKFSREKYYKPSYKIKKIIRNRSSRWNQPFTPIKPDFEFSPEQFEYDEF